MNSGVFWDASALVKAYSKEDGSPNVEGALALRNVRGFITDYVALEVITALGKKLRTGEISRKAYRRRMNEFRRDFPGAFDCIVVEEHTRRQSHELAEKYQRLGTSAMDILHLASANQAAEMCHPRPLVMLCADKPLLEAAREEGLEVYNPEIHPHSALRSALDLRQ